MQHPKGIIPVSVAMTLLVVAVIAAGATYFITRTDDSVQEVANTNVILNVNSIVTNTNVEVTNSNINASSNQNTNSANSSYPGQEWPASNDDKALFQTYTSGETSKTVYSIQPGQEAKVHFITPNGYSLVSNSGDRLIWLEKEHYLYIFDTRDSSIRKTSLPALQSGDIRFESAGPSAYSSDGVEALVRYNLFDKNSEAYKGEFAGPQPVSAKHYRYNIVTDTFTPADTMNALFYSLWDRTSNVAYNHLSGEGVGSKTPITKYLLGTNKKEESADYGNNSSPAFSKDGKWAAVPAVEKAPLKIYIFALPDISTPVKTITLPEVKDSEPITNTIGYVYEFIWTQDNKNLVLSFQNSIFLINIETEKATRIFENSNKNASYTGWDYYPSISGSGRYIYYVDYSNVNQETLKSAGNIAELKVYDTQTASTQTLKKVTGEENILLIR